MSFRVRAVTALVIPLLAVPAALCTAATAGAAPVAAPASGGHAIAPGTRFAVDPTSEAARQVVTDLQAGDVPDAVTMAQLASYPEAAWFSSGTPAQVRQAVHQAVGYGDLEHRTSTLVAYDIPGRDCSQYSAGGAADDAAYRAWIAAFARGIGGSKAVVVLEPDALANLPSDCSATTDPTGELTAARIADIGYAIGVLEAQPNTAVYLDAGHSAWHSVGDMASRLIQAGVQRAQGFFLNVSNFQPTPQLDEYGTWVSDCIAYVVQQGGTASSCASQYYPATATDPSTWHLTDEWYAAHLTVPATTHFVVDTSRNGQGAWTPPAGVWSDPQDWCNPPDRGVGVRPTADTGVPLADAYLWIKTIGESDGTCTRGTAGPADPVYGTPDPVAGAWWPQQALGLARRAVPPLTFGPVS